MKAKKLILSVIAVAGLSFWASNANASTWYVRDGGGNATQCTGATNAVYLGSGSAQPCAFNHPRYAIGWDADKPQAGTIKGGDTVYIDGDSDINPGQQAQYLIGYDDTGANTTPTCSTGWPYDCTLANIPAGSSASQPTSIIGTGSHKPQLWGNERVWQVLTASNNYITLQWLEITDHQACAYSDPVGACNYGGPYPYGAWAEDGIILGGSGLTLTDVYVHGLGRYGINVADGTTSMGSVTFTRLWVVGNGYAGVTTGLNNALTGTWTLNQPVIEWNGCVEAYPMKTAGIDNPTNYSNCFGQASGGYGDGLAFGPVGNINAGNWVIVGPGSISFNTQDGLDTLHGDGNGTISVDKMRFEGNAGQQVKANGNNFNLTNSIVIGDCGWWYGSAQAAAGAMKLGDVCRANGDAILFNVTNGSTANLFNNTILSNGSVVAESTDGETTGCNSSTAINFKNNIVYGGYSWGDDTAFNGSGGNAQTTYIYNDGSNGNGAGTCGTLVWNEDYNVVYNTKNNNQNCVGAHDKCGTNPGFASTFPMGTAGGAANTYYQGTTPETLLSLSSSSPAIASGVAGLIYWNNENDYHNQVRTSPPSRGGLEANSCAANANGCFYNSDCCSGTCSNLVCGGSGAPSQPVVAITSPSNATNITVGTGVTITANASETNGTITNVSIYNGSTLLQSMSSSPYSFTMTNLAVGIYNLTAKATDANGVSTTSSPVTVTIINIPILPSLPVVNITNPSSGSTFTAGSNVTVTTTASETNGTIKNISLYNGSGILLGTSTTSPYNFVDTNMSAGGYSFFAVATDVNGISTTSSTITVTVTAPLVPVISITSPNSGSSFTAGSTINILASASETNGSIAQVQFYNGSTLLGTDSVSPYNFNWTNVTAGTYILTTKAIDVNSVSTTSSAVTVTVTAAPSAPVVTMTSPANGSTFTKGANITVTASASEANGTIASVSFYNGTGLLSTVTTAPYTYTWTNGFLTSYTVTAVATDANGVSTTSNPVTITLAASSTPIAPVVAITSPTSGSSITAGSNLSINATASEINGTISSVSFFNGSTLLGTSKRSPYSFMWKSMSAGTYNLTAQAVDKNNITTTSSTVAVTVTAPTVVPSITSQPVSVTVTAPSTATFTVAATGTPAPTFQWMFSVNGGSFTNIVGATSASYTTFATSLPNSGDQFECVVTNASGSVTSNPATLTVNPAPVAANITSQPTSVTVTAPATATFTVAVTGTPAPTFQWMQSVNGGVFTNINGATNASYTTPATAVSNSGSQFKCVVSNASGTVTSSAASLTVNPTPVAANITSQPASITVTAPATATFTVTATGTPAPTFQWMQSVNGGVFTNISGATSASYTTAATSVANNGTQFECVVSNASGTVTSSAASLTVNPTPVAANITSQPTSVTVTAPATATFTVAATGTPAPTFQWMQSVNGGVFTNISGATSASYTTPATTVSNSGSQFKCVVTNASGTVPSSAATLTVNPTPVAANITSQPVSMTVTAPATATFTVAATGTPAPTFQWMMSVGGGAFTNISGATSASYTTVATSVTNSGIQFECVVTNASGTVTSSAATLTVNPTPVAANITSQPTSVTVTAPATATFTVAATGTPAPTFQWMQSVNGGVFVNISGATSVSYTTAATSVANSGTQFECVVTNASGSVISSAASLTVNPTPVDANITSQPASMTVTAPATATFTVAATGTPAPTFQWMQSVNGGAFVNINGATGTSYTTAATSVANSGTQFECVVTNASGNVTSNAATLTVNQAPLPIVAITSPVDGSTFTKGSNITVSASASEANGTITGVSFYNGTALLATINTPPYTYTWANGVLTNYTLTAVATDANGASTTSTPVVITLVAPSSPVVALIGPADGSNFTAGSNVTITANASETNGSIAQVQFYNGATLLGTDSTAPYNFIWTNVPAGNYNLIAKATDANGASITSSNVTVTVTAPPVPVISLTGPANGNNFSAGSNITITANASETNGSIAQVQFYNGSTLLGTDSASPYTFTWNNVPAGGYNLTAKAIDANGASVTSSNVTITVTTPPSPVVALTGPANGSNFTAGSNITITADASEINGSIAQVQFYNGSTLLGTTTSNPYSYTWNNAPAGNYNLTAVAVDNNGIATTSTAVAINISSGTPTVNLSVNNTSFAKFPAVISLSATASEADGTINQVQLYNGTMLLSNSSNFTWTVQMPGTYLFTAQATDSNGVVVTSQPIIVTVR